MTVLRFRLFVALPALLLLPLAAVCGGGGSVDIPEGTPASNQAYTLLYNTLGYESAATKRVLVRQNDTAAVVAEGLAFEWRLVGKGGKQVTAGRATYAGRPWGIPLWSADFTAVDEPGEYRMLVQAPDVTLATGTIRIDRFALFRATFSAVALDNAEARQAPVELDNGFFDANTRSGDAAAHAGFLVGLTEAFDRRLTPLSEADRRRLRDAVDRAVDYLILLTDPATGEVRPRSYTRPYGKETQYDSAEVARALAHYAAIFRDDEPDKAERAFRRAKAIDARLGAAPEYGAPMRAAVRYDLYRYSRQQEFLDGAAAAVRELAAYDLRTMERRSTDALPHFEALYLMWRDLPAHPDRALWEETARNVAAQYKGMLDRNALQVIPPGVTDTGTGATPAGLWDAFELAPPPGDGPFGVVSSGWFLGRAVDAMYLADMTDDASLEKIATGSLGWVAGMNAGVPPERASGPDAGPLQPAALIAGLDGSVRAWSSWEWARPRPFGSLVAGMRGGLTFNDGYEAADTSIALDGAWLHAITVYEDQLNPGRRPVAAAAAYPSGGVHLRRAEASEAGGVLQLLVAVADGEGAPVEGVKVVVAWAGQLAQDMPVEDSLRVTECVTAADGACVAVLAPGALPAGRPIVAVVTNLDHRALADDPSADESPRTSTYR